MIRGFTCLIAIPTSLIAFIVQSCTISYLFLNYKKYNGGGEAKVLNVIITELHYSPEVRRSLLYKKLATAIGDPMLLIMNLNFMVSQSSFTFLH